MASHVVVIDSSFRRQQVKTTPNTYLRDILEEACSKLGKDPDQFVLNDSSRPPKTLDLSLTYRLAGLVGGQKLQLVQGSRSPSVVKIALKLPESLGGQRLQDKFPSNTSLWMVLRKFEEAVAGGSAQKMNLTQRGIPSTQTGQGRLEYEQPVIKVLQRELSDIVGLQKTLAQLGYNSGSVLLTLDFRNSGIPMEEAVAQISRYFEPAPTANGQASKANGATTITPPVAATGAHAEPVAQMSSLPEANQTEPKQPGNREASPSEDIAMTPAPSQIDAVTPVQESALVASSTDGAAKPDPTPEASSAMEIDGPTTSSEPSIQVYKPPTSSTPHAASQSHNEADFVPTIEHAQAHQAVLARASQNRRLQSDAEIAAENERKASALGSIESATIRVRFPDQMQVDISISAADTVGDLYGKVKEMLRDPGLGFELRYTGHKGAPVSLAREGKEAERLLIRGLGWKGRVLVTMVWEAEVPVEKRGRVLRDELVGQAKELSVPSVAEGSVGRAVQGKEEKAAEDGKKAGGKGDLEAKMKKFLGFGKK